MATAHHKQVRFPLLLPEQAFEQLQAVAKESDISISALIRSMLGDIADTGTKANSYRDIQISNLLGMANTSVKLFEELDSRLVQLEQAAKESD